MSDIQLDTLNPKLAAMYQKQGGRGLSCLIN